MNYLFFAIGFIQAIKRSPFGGDPMVTGPEIAFLTICAFFVVSAYPKLARGGLSFSGLSLAISLSGAGLILAAFFHAAMASFFGPDFSSFISITISLVGGLLLCLGLVNTPHADRSPNYYASYYILGVAVSLVAPYLLFTLGLLPTSVYFAGSGRYRALLEHPNQVGILASTCACFAAAAEWRRIFKIAVVIVMVGVCLLCGSKLNLAISSAILVGMIVFIVSPGNFLTKAASSAFIFSLLSLSIDVVVQLGARVMAAVNPREAYRILQFAAAPDRSETTTDRLYIWSSAIRGGAEAFPFGVGASEAPYHLIGFTHAHNVYANYFLIYGAFGIMFTVVMTVLVLISLFRNIGRNILSESAIPISLMGLLIASNFSDSLSSTTLPFFIVLLAISQFGVRRASYAK